MPGQGMDGTSRSLIVDRFSKITNMIVDGSSPFTRSLTTADSNCQPLFILRTGRELGRIGFVFGAWFFCQFLTAYAYPRLTFGTISGTIVVFLAPNSALVTGGDNAISRFKFVSIHQIAY
jgi:hypothetical protein